MGEGDLHAIIVLTLGATNQKQRIVALRTGPLVSQQWRKRKRGICSDGFGFFFAYDDVVVSPLQFFQEYIGVPSQQLKSFAPIKDKSRIVQVSGKPIYRLMFAVVPLHSFNEGFITLLACHSGYPYPLSQGNR